MTDGQPFPGGIPNLSDYPALDREIDRLQLGSWPVSTGMEKLCEENAIEIKPDEEINAAYQRINDILAERANDFT